MASEETERKHSGLIPFKPGQSGNPAGRPKGARSKLGEVFLEDVLSDWEQHGAQAVVDCRTKDPVQYCKMVASILPKELNVKVNELDDLTDEQLARQYAAIAASLVAAGLGLSAGNAEAGGAEQAVELPTIQ